jgi:hypothetical protein
MSPTNRFAVALCLAAAFADARAALSQAEAQEAVAAVLPELAAIRGFPFVSAVPVTVIDDAQARAYALARFHRMTPESKIRADQAVYRLLGLVPADMDVVKTLLDVLEEQAGGFYDPATKSFYLLDDMPKAMTGLLTAHEMTHALDDQRYDIDGRLTKLGDDDDASFGLSAVAEGSATIASAVYLAAASASGTIAANDLAAVGDMEQIRTERLNAMPPVMRRQLLGPYLLGVSFLLRGRPGALAEGFPQADVNAAWERPPRSSEQILHPEKYWDAAKRDAPKRVAIPDPARTLGEGWTRAGSGILGELTIGSLVGAPAPDASAIGLGGSAGSWTNAAASGWGGDRFELWTNGSAGVVLLETVWDTERDAEEFVQALPRGRPGFTAKRSGRKVGVVAGDAGEARAALLALLVKP